MNGRPQTSLVEDFLDCLFMVNFDDAFIISLSLPCLFLIVLSHLSEMRT